MHIIVGNLGNITYTIPHVKPNAQPKSSSPFLTRKGSHPLLELGKTTLSEEQNEENP